MRPFLVRTRAGADCHGLGSPAWVQKRVVSRNSRMKFHHAARSPQARCGPWPANTARRRLGVALLLGLLAAAPLHRAAAAPLALNASAAAAAAGDDGELSLAELSELLRHTAEDAAALEAANNAAGGGTPNEPAAAVAAAAAAPAGGPAPAAAAGGGSSFAFQPAHVTPETLAAFAALAAPGTAPSPVPAASPSSAAVLRWFLQVGGRGACA